MKKMTLKAAEELVNNFKNYEVRKSIDGEYWEFVCTDPDADSQYEMLDSACEDLYDYESAISMFVSRILNDDVYIIG